MLTNSKTDHLFIDKGTLTTSFPLPVNYIKSNFANCKMPKIVVPFYCFKSMGIQESKHESRAILVRSHGKILHKGENQ